MPYKIIGRTVYHKVNGRWFKKQTARTIANAKATIRILENIDYGKRITLKAARAAVAHRRSVARKRTRRVFSRLR